MQRLTIYIAMLLLILLGEANVTYAQISGAFPPSFTCRDEEIDTQAVCTRIFFCTQPPNPIEAFTLGAFAFKTCPGSPVINVARVDGAKGGSQASADGVATSLFWGRRIKEQASLGDCNGNVSLVIDFEDPQGCNPPPPPPPPPDPVDCPPDDGTGPICFKNCGGCPSPIIVDLNGNGFFLTDAAHGLLFDIKGNGAPMQIAWTAAGADNGFLALPGSDGLVHNGKELFGNFTPQPPSAHPNGFLALAQYDANGDGVIDASDPVYSRLRIWRDANHDGISQPEELHTLAEMGVSSIVLNYSLSMRTDEFGNVFRYKGKVNQGINGKSEVGRQVYDVFFVHE